MLAWLGEEGTGVGGGVMRTFISPPPAKKKKKANKRWNNCKCYFLARHPLISHLNYTRGRNGRGRNGPLQQLPSRIGPRRGRDGHLCLIVRLPPPAPYFCGSQSATGWAEALWPRLGQDGWGRRRRRRRWRKEESRLFHSATKQRQRVGGRRRTEALGGVTVLFFSLFLFCLLRAR